MRKSTIAIVALSLALVGSNAWWLFELVRRLHGVENMSWDLHDSRLAGRTVMSLLPKLAGKPLPRGNVVAALEEAGVPVTKMGSGENELVAGGVLFAFDSEGNLSEVKEPLHFRD